MLIGKRTRNTECQPFCSMFTLKFSAKHSLHPAFSMACIYRPEAAVGVFPDLMFQS